MRSALVIFYRHVRCEGDSVTVEVTGLPLEDTHGCALLKASRHENVKAFFGEDCPMDHPAAIMPTGGPFDETWVRDRSYKAGEWGGIVPPHLEPYLRIRDTLLAICERSGAVTLYPLHFQIVGIEIPRDIIPGDVGATYMVPENLDTASLWLQQLQQLGKVVQRPSGHIYIA